MVGRLVFANGTDAAFDLLACVPPHRAPRVIRESPLAGDTGWIAVDRHTLATRFPGVFAIGDVVSISLWRALRRPRQVLHRDRRWHAEPRPVVTVHPPRRRWHLGKVLFEQSWLHTKL